MPDEDLKELLGAAGAAEGPPMGFSAEEIIGRGGRIRRRRKGFAVAATSVATAGAIAAVVLLVPSRAPAPPVQPAGPNVATSSVTPPPRVVEPAPTSVPTLPAPQVGPSPSGRQETSQTPGRRSPSRTSTPSADHPPAPPAASAPSTGMPPQTRPDQPTR